VLPVAGFTVKAKRVALDGSRGECDPSYVLRRTNLESLAYVGHCLCGGRRPVRCGPTGRAVPHRRSVVTRVRSLVATHEAYIMHDPVHSAVDSLAAAIQTMLADPALEARRMSVPAGTVIYEPTASAQNIHFIHRGQVRLYQVGDE